MAHARAALRNIDPASLAWFMEATCDRHLDPFLCVHVSIGQNDYSQGRSLSDLRADTILAVQALRTAWALNGYNQDNLVVWLQSPQPLTGLAAPYMAYVLAVGDLFRTLAPTLGGFATPPGDLITGDQITANGWSDGAGNEHLTAAGYTALDTLCLAQAATLT